MCNHEIKFIFYSKNNFNVGSKLRTYFKNLGMELNYCGCLGDLVNTLSSKPNCVLFFDKDHIGYASFISRLLDSNLDLTKRCKVVYVDDNLQQYAEYVNNRNFYSIPETNMEPALFNIITKCKLLNYNNYDDIDFRKINKMVSDCLCKLGFSYKLIGFKYIKQCIEQIVKNDFNIGSLTKDIYPHIADINFTTESNVERSIRTAIDAAYQKTKFNIEGYEVLRDHKCSNRFFISCLVDKLMNELNIQVS